MSAMRSRLAGFWCRGWLGIITGLFWAGILAAGFLTVLNGSGETGANVLIAVGWTVGSMAWGGVIVWHFRREPMRKVVTEIRDGQRKILGRLDERAASERGPARPALRLITRD